MTGFKIKMQKQKLRQKEIDQDPVLRYNKMILRKLNQKERKADADTKQ